MKRIVIAHTSGMMQIIGWSDEQPPPMIRSLDPADGQYCLVEAKRTYYLYKPLMVPATGRLGETFDPRQV